jgi:rod shape-determining protein MreD
MKSNIYWAILVIVTAQIEATWLSQLRIQGVQPDLILVLVVYFAIVDGEQRAMMTGLLGGLFQDVAADTGLGHHVLCLVLVGYTVGRLSERLITDNPAVKTSAVFFASILHDVIYIAVDYVQHVDPQAAYTMAIGTVPRAFYTALTTPFLFFFLDRTPTVEHRRVL